MLKALYVFLISMLPFIELRGAIPVGTALGLPFYWNYIIAVVANLIPAPFILLFIPKILDFLKRFRLFRPIVEWLNDKAYRGSQKILKTEGAADDTENVEGVSDREKGRASDDVSEKGTSKRLMGIFIGLLLFVAVPLPTTGAWTASLVAALFNFPKKMSFFAITLGVMLCGVIMTLASYGVLGFLKIFL